MFVSNQEIEKLTGKVRYSAQAKWLRDHGYLIGQRDDGSVILLVDELHSKLLSRPVANKGRPKKDWRPIVKAAWAAGWWCERRRKYIYCRSPDDNHVVKIPMTPSDWRTMKNVRAHFHRAGLDL